MCQHIFGDSVGELTISTMKEGDPNTNRSDLNKNNIIKPTPEHLSEVDCKMLETYHKEVDEIILSCYEVTRQGLIQRDIALIDILKSEVTPELRSNHSFSLDDVQVMNNYALERQVKSINEMMCRLIEVRDGKRSIDPIVHAFSSSCTVNFTQTNPQTSGTAAGGSLQPNPSAQPMNHFYSQPTIDGSAPACGIPQQTTTNTFGQRYIPPVPSFSMPNPGLTPCFPWSDGRAYANTNSNYQALYTTIAYTDPIPLPSGSARHLPNYPNNNTMRYATHGPPDHGGYSYETPPQFLIRPQLIEMMPARATSEPCADPSNLITQLATILI
jgi:hypothetical protein